MSVLQACNITKVFPGTLALDDVSISFHSGKVNALVGKNGSGKTTLVKIINGAYEATGGTMNIDGKDFMYQNPKQAFDAGIATVYQEMSLIPGLSVAENILIGRYKMNGPFVDWKSTYREAEMVLENLGISLPLKETVNNLSVWQCQVVEIAKAMSANPKVIFLDEPTSALAQNETALLFKLIRELSRKDVIIIYISHRLQELWEIADTCSVLRDGKYVGCLDMPGASHKELLNLMFGNVEVRERPDDIKASSETVLKIDSLTREPAFRDISFELKKGEVLGIAGMLGSGRTELLRAIFGADTAHSGNITIKEELIAHPTPLVMRKHGVAFIPEDRKSQGLVQILSIKSNLTHSCLDRILKGPFIDPEKEDEYSSKQIKDLEIKIPGDEYPMTSLSGGNQQKVVLGKWLNIEPRVLIFDELSRGIDVNAKQQIFQIVWDLAREGLSSIVVSSELEELLEICNRILIMRGGEIVKEVNPDKLSVEELYALCMGGSEA
jgi:ribose transport system ATP-binding protein